MPDATVVPPPADGGPATTSPPATPDVVLAPGVWVSLDDTTTIAQDGTWLAVGDQGDVWLVAQAATNPTFLQLGYLAPAAAGQSSVSVPATPTGSPQLPPPVLPPPNPNPPTRQITPLDMGLGALGGGLTSPEPWRVPVETPIIGGSGGVKIKRDPPKDPGGNWGPTYLEIPLPGGGTLDIRYDPAVGDWVIRFPGSQGIWVPWTVIKNRLIGVS